MDSVAPLQRKYLAAGIKNYFGAIILLCNVWACGPPAENPDSQPEVVAASDLTIPSEDAPITPTSELEKSLINAGLVDVQSLDSSIMVDLKYSSIDNFVGVDVYGELERCYLQPEVAEKLAEAQKHLSSQRPGYRLLIYDGARPRSVQQILWDTLQKPEDLKPLYVADPQEGSIHNYGSAVDLTIADEQGKPLDMGTHYDFFGELAYPTKEDELLSQGLLSQTQIENRNLLRTVMKQAGFSGIDTEWWHFNAYSRKKAQELYQVIP